MTTTAESTDVALRAALGADRIRPPTAADTVAGTAPRWVADAHDTDEVASVMRVAAEHGLSVVPRGAGSRINWGAPPERVDLVLDLSGANRIVEHAAGDLVLHAQAGTPIAEVRRIAAEAGQQLAIDQPLPAATLGGIIATATGGPGRHLFGGVRDLLIGITVVRADGTVTTSGGKVVKNVAGYDLGKVYTGSHGTLGVITEAIFRLHPLAAEHRWVSVTVPDAEQAGRAADLLRSSQAVPTAVELDTDSGRESITVCAELEGQPAVTGRRAGDLAGELGAAVGQPAEVLEVAPPWWGQHPFDPERGTGLRLGVRPSALPRLLAGVQQEARRSGLRLAVRGAAGLGVLEVAVEEMADPENLGALLEALREVCDSAGGYATVLRAPPEVAAAVDVWGPIEPGVLRLMRRTKDQFDPEHRLSPGRFVGGL